MTFSTHDSYWEDRKASTYYRLIRALVGRFTSDAGSIIDVGSAGCPYIEWFRSVPKRTSLDYDRPYQANGVASITGDFLTWEPDQPYDVVMCFQVLEHVPDAQAFAQKLLSIGKVVVVSVPYKWREGRTPGHVHDPVDQEKMHSWFGREPDFEYICREAIRPIERLIQIYDLRDHPLTEADRRKLENLCRRIDRVWTAYRKVFHDRERWIKVRKTSVYRMKRFILGPEGGFRSRLLRPLRRSTRTGTPRR